ncbi:phage antirepressor KilAC domain-containing protein [Salinicola sp. CPA57]|uniref:phage antirepressor KilAC domain-containing protein n=1 Tax=Salinicola sp. CPA57 TaxID=1949080 RepID=UPI000DA18E4D|nr:phage antirepressor KilAC domain-containing protein [Salinicola sp. CPA57]
MRYDLQTAAKLLGTGRTTLCRQLRERHVFDTHNLPEPEHVRRGRFTVEMKSVVNSGLGREVPYGKTLVTERGLLWLAGELGVRIHREAANDA